jgi:hypothetical protein
MARPPDLRQRSDTLAEAMAALEKGLRKWFAEQGIEVESTDCRQE